MVEPGLSDRPNLGDGREHGQPVPITGHDPGREMGMHADRRIDAQGTGEVDARHGRRQLPAGGQEPLHSGQPRSREDLPRVAREGIRLKMAMRVDKTHR